MTIGELHAIVSGGESEQVEFKSTTGQRTAAAQTACAMLNGQGGFILFGVTDAREIKGQQVTPDTMQKVVAELRRIEPPMLLQPEEVPLADGKAVVAIRIPGDGAGPYTFDGRPYVRQGPTTSPMPQDRYRQMLLEQMHPAHRWETQYAHDITLDGLDAAEITRTVDEAIRRGRMDEPGTRDPQALLLGLGLLRNGQLLNAAVALFARETSFLPYYTQCQLRMARFKDTTKGEFIDNQQIFGNTFYLFQRAQRFLREHLPIAGRVVPGLFERIDDPLYPPEALREALANALCHRDYSAIGGSVSLAIYDDRLEISSTGRLHFGLTPQDLTRPHASRPWNKLIANVFYRRGIIEQWGRGTLKMAELNRQAGLVPPEFEEQTGEVVVRFRPIGFELSELQEKLLDVLARIGPASMSDILVELSGTPRRTVLSNLDVLRARGLVTMEGKGRWVRWLLVGRHT